MLSVTYAYKNPDNLQMTISNFQHGHFELASDSGSVITLFTPKQIKDKAIMFAHDGSQESPSYKVSVSDGYLITSPTSAQIDFDAAPVLVNNFITIQRGQKILITSSMLSATDIDTDSTLLTFIFSDIQHGRFSLISDPNTNITSFLQSQILNRMIQFIHDGSSEAPSFGTTVSDGRIPIGPANALITFDPQQTIIMADSSNSIKNAIIAGTVSGSIGLIF